MARVDVGDGAVTVRLNPLEMAGAMHRSVRVPLERVVSVESTDDLWGMLRGMRVPGTGIPRVIALGTWRGGGGKDFAAIYGSGPGGVVITLDDQAQWARLLVSCRDPEAVRASVEAAR